MPEISSDLIKQGSKRIWRAWKIGFIIALIAGVVFFAVGMNAEVQHKRTKLEGEEPISFFSISNPNLQTGFRTYTINITNNQPYTIMNLKMEFLGTGASSPAPASTSQTDTLSSGGEQTYTVQVAQGAESVVFDLDGDDLPLSLTDLNLHVTSPDGAMSWDSMNPGNDENIRLTSLDINSGGYGAYTVRISHDSGLLDVGYTFSSSVEFGSVINMINHAVEMPEGSSQKFTFTLDITEAQMGSVEFKITAKINIGENFDVEIWRLYNAAWAKESEHTPTPNSVKGGEPYGPVDTTGIVSIVAYCLAVVTGFLYWVRIRFGSGAKPKFIHPAHCFLSLMSFVLALDHTFIALQKDWPWTSPGMIFSYLSIGTMAFYTVFSFYDVEGKEVLGEQKWRYVHVFLLILLILWVVLHFGLMGDHLGFLK